MRKLFLYIICVVSLLFTACDVHEFPEERGNLVPFLLHLDFNTELPLYKEITYTRNGSFEANASEFAYGYDVRYIIKAYRTDNVRSESRVADTTFVFTKSDVINLNYTARLELPEGAYSFQVWTDYVEASKASDLYYNTTDFSEIILANKKNHPGSNDFRDAFRGYATATVYDPDCYTGEAVTSITNEATATMMRPMGKFKFVSTDVDVFLTRVYDMMKEKGIELGGDKSIEGDQSTEGDQSIEGSKAAYEEMLQKIQLNDFKVVFRYNLFMPCSFNMFTDKPADSWTGMSFTSRMYTEEYNEMTLGFDYIFVNGTETTVSVSVEVYNKYDELMSSSNPIDVPIVRSRMTLVKGSFLTSKASEGVAISPDFDGEYNIEIL